MKKILTLIATLILAMSCVFGLTACGNTQKVKAIDIKLTEEDYAFVVKQGNTTLQSDFNAYLAEIKADGTFDAIVAKYFEGKGEKVGYDVTVGEVTNNASNFVVATNCPFEPFEYVGVDGKIYGVDMEIAAGYAQKKNLTLVIRNIDFDAIFNQVDNGYADIGMAGITVSEEREALYDFTDKYYKASQKIIVKADCTDFDSCVTMEDVENVIKGLAQGTKIGYQTGTTGNWYVAGDADWGYDGFANIESKGYKTAQLAVYDLINGNIYAVVVDEAPAEALVKSFNK